MTQQTSPQWSWSNLHEHLITRNFYDKDCWEEILGHAPMTEAEYEHESQEAYKNALYEYEGNDSKKEHRRGLYRVDGRAIKTIASHDRRDMVTCYHIDNGQHEMGSASRPSTQTALEQMEALSMRMENRMASVTRFDLVEKNISGISQTEQTQLYEKERNLKSLCVTGR